MKKLRLGDNPKNFKKTIDIVLLDGTTAPLEISYIYRTRKQFAELVDANIAKAEAEAKEAAAATPADGEAPKRITIAESYAAVDKARTDHVLQIADGWGLDDEFTAENLLQFEDEYPGALHAISIAYAQAVAEARAKN
ncbi:phage tail assembly chaperone [[Empedobacter] haloabium]|uniref:Phage tail assembly chaperone n=1 Tax=[Empedobacter] haloabium TaxID=592317 RepID=A0ABZ1USY9_9BURK